MNVFWIYVLSWNLKMHNFYKRFFFKLFWNAFCILQVFIAFGDAYNPNYLFLLHWVTLVKINEQYIGKFRQKFVFLLVFAKIFWFCAFLLPFSVLAFNRNFSRSFVETYLVHCSVTDIAFFFCSSFFVFTVLNRQYSGLLDTWPEVVLKYFQLIIWMQRNGSWSIICG